MEFEDFFGGLDAINELIKNTFVFVVLEIIQKNSPKNLFSLIRMFFKIGFIKDAFALLDNIVHDFRYF